jgi:hypothetical protein
MHGKPTERQSTKVEPVEQPPEVEPVDQSRQPIGPRWIAGWRLLWRLRLLPV